jgi:hypothetical protein
LFGVQYKLLCTPHKLYSGDKIQKTEMGGACGMYGGEKHAWFWWGNLREGDHLEVPGIDGRIILKWI